MPDYDSKSRLNRIEAELVDIKKWMDRSTTLFKYFNTSIDKLREATEQLSKNQATPSVEGIKAELDELKLAVNDLNTWIRDMQMDSLDG